MRTIDVICFSFKTENLALLCRQQFPSVITKAHLSYVDLN